MCRSEIKYVLFYLLGKISLIKDQLFKDMSDLWKLLACMEKIFQLWSVFASANNKDSVILRERVDSCLFLCSYGYHSCDRSEIFFLRTRADNPTVFLFFIKLLLHFNSMLLVNTQPLTLAMWIGNKFSGETWNHIPYSRSSFNMNIALTDLSMEADS